MLSTFGVLLLLFFFHLFIPFLSLLHSFIELVISFWCTMLCCVGFCIGSLCTSNRISHFSFISNFFCISYSTFRLLLHAVLLYFAICFESNFFSLTNLYEWCEWTARKDLKYFRDCYYLKLLWRYLSLDVDNRRTGMRKETNSSRLTRLICFVLRSFRLTMLSRQFQEIEFKFPWYWHVTTRIPSTIQYHKICCTANCFVVFFLLMFCFPICSHFEFA